jgi:hypothetical protein
MDRIPDVLRVILTAELFLGGQCRITPALTPGLYQRVMRKADGTQKYLPFIPIKDPKEHTRFIGFLMCTAGALLCARRTRLLGGLLSISLTLAGVYTQWKMKIPYWLPSVNTVLAAVIIWNERKAGF